jgi:hypothetical protein
MTAKKTLKNLPRKGVSTRKASAVKGGKRREPRIALNHNQSFLVR